MIKFFTIHALASATEETLRSILRNDDTQQLINNLSTADFITVYEYILSKTKLQKFINLFNILRLIRNTIHNNGVHRPNKPHESDPQIISYNGKNFEFKIGEGLQWLNEENMIWLLKEFNDAMFEIITSNLVRSIKYCPRVLK